VEEAPERILLGGCARSLTGVRRRLAMLRAPTELAADPTAIHHLLDGAVLAVVLVEPLDSGSSSKVVKSVRSHPAGASVPVFVLVPKEVPRRVMALYRAGVSAVFEWPREASIFPHVLTELLGLELVHGQARKSDARLARAVRARLRATGGSAAALRVRTTNGQVALSGEVPALWEKEDIRRIVSLTPGVRAVRLDALEVIPSGISDQALRKTVRDVIRASTDSNDTLSVSVESGLVTLAGSISSRMELRRITDLLSHLRGVRGLDSMVAVSPREQRQARVRTRELQRSLQSMFPSQRTLRVNMLGPAAVLSGTVSTLDAKERVESFVRDHPSVERVVNKLQVRGGR
jgi:osmotically-inducible protein OsmY